MSNNRKLSKYKNIPKFNFATVGIVVGVGLIALLLVFFFKITFEEPNTKVTTKIEQHELQKKEISNTVKPPVKQTEIQKPSTGSPSITIVPQKEEKKKQKTELKPAQEQKKISVRPEQKPKTKPEVTKKVGVKPSKSVKVPSGKLVYVIQIGSFKDRKRALLLKKEITRRGYKAIIVKAVVKGHTWYRVRVGSRSDSSSIKKMIGSLKKEKVTGGRLKPIVMR